MRFMLVLAALLSFSVSCLAACNDQWSVQLEDTNTTISNDFTVWISGTGGQNAVSINQNSGTVTQGGRTTNVVVNYMIPWEETTLYAFVGSDSTGLMMGWAYCHGSKLTDLWLEDTTGVSGFIKPQVTGVCQNASTAMDSVLDTMDRCYAVDEPDNVPTISGSDLTLQSGSPGMVILAGEQFNVLPFAVVDCETCESTTLNGGWVEVHAVMKSTSNICLGIFYLQVIPESTVPLNYVDCFFSNIQDTTFTAQYQINNEASSMTLAAPTSTQSIASASPPMAAATTSLGAAASSSITTTATSATLHATPNDSTPSPTSSQNSGLRTAVNYNLIPLLLLLTWYMSCS